MTENDVINKVISMIKEGKSLVGQSGKIAIKALEKVQREYKGMILDNNWWTTFRGSFETEDEVFEFIFDRMDTSDFEDSYIDAGGHGDCNESVKITAEEKRDFIFEFMMKILDEVQQYRAIGTVKECMAAMEKQKAKKLDWNNDEVTDMENLEARR